MATVISSMEAMRDFVKAFGITDPHITKIVITMSINDVVRIDITRYADATTSLKVLSDKYILAKQPEKDFRKCMYRENEICMNNDSDTVMFECKKVCKLFESL